MRESFAALLLSLLAVKEWVKMLFFLPLHVVQLTKLYFQVSRSIRGVAKMANRWPEAKFLQSQIEALDRQKEKLNQNLLEMEKLYEEGFFLTPEPRVRMWLSRRMQSMLDRQYDSFKSRSK